MEWVAITFVIGVFQFLKVKCDWEMCIRRTKTFFPMISVFITQQVGTIMTGVALAYYKKGRE